MKSIESLNRLISTAKSTAYFYRKCKDHESAEYFNYVAKKLDDARSEIIAYIRKKDTSKYLL